MGEANLKAEAEAKAAQQAQQNAMVMQELWSIQQKEVLWVNGFSGQEVTADCVRIAFTEKTRVELPVSVRASVVMPGACVDALITQLLAIRERQQKMGVAMTEVQVANGQDHDAETQLDS